MELQKWESVSKIAAAILIPIAVAWMANEVTLANKKRETEAKLVEVATTILTKEVGKTQTPDQRKLRLWAVQVINTYSGVPMGEEVQTALVDRISLPADTKVEGGGSGPWGVVFGADKTVGAAAWEIRGAGKTVDVSSAGIFLRAGMYRAVSLHTERSEAEEALGKFKGYRSSSFVVDMSKWCPNTAQQADYLECKI